MTRPIPRPSSELRAADLVSPPASNPSDTRPIPVLVRASPPHPSTGLVRRLASHSWQRPRGLETAWYHCLLYPLRAWPLVLGLAGVLTLVCVVAALALPALVGDFRADASGLVWVLGLLFTVPLLIFGYASGFLNCVFTSALAGETRHIRWPGRDVALALKSGASWLLCFLAGPIVPAGAALLFWIYGGDLQSLDWMILAETTLLAMSCWFLLVLALNQNDRLIDLTPTRVVGMVRRQGYRLIALAVFAAVLGLAHVCWACAAVARIHGDFVFGWFWLFLSLTSGMYWATFLFRWAGLWFYWKRIRERQEPIVTEATGLPASPPASSLK